MKPQPSIPFFPLLTVLFLLSGALPVFSQSVVGIAIDKRDNKIVIWYNNGKIATGSSYLLNSYQPSSSEYTVPAGKSENDIVGMSLSSANRTYAWYADGTRSAGVTYKDLVSNRAAERFNLPPGKSPGDIVGIAIDGADKVYAWYSDYTLSIGNSKDLNSVQESTRYRLPAGMTPGNIIEMEFSNNDQLYTWLTNGTVLAGTYNDLGSISVNNRQENSNFVTDPAGHQYTKIHLGDLVWTRENLHYKINSGSWHYENNAANGAVFGRLYTWQAAADACHALGAGWRLPTDAEWSTLSRYWGGQNEAYSDLIENGRSGFSARLGGTRYDDGNYFGLNFSAGFWSASTYNAGNNMAWAYSFYSSNRTFVRHEVYKLGGLSCRCVHE